MKYVFYTTDQKFGIISVWKKSLIITTTAFIWLQLE